MNARHERFVQEYLVDLNATQAAIRAGYAERGARVTGCNLLKRPDVIEAIVRGRRDLEARTQVTQERVIQELAAIALSDPRKLFDDDGRLKAVHDLDDETAATLAAVESEDLFEGRGDEREHIGTLRKIKRWDKVRALELLGKHYGMFSDKLQLEGAGGGPVVVELVQFGSTNQDSR